MNALLRQFPAWMGVETEDSDVVLLSRISLSRNSEDFLFPHNIDRHDLIPLLARSDLAVSKMYPGHSSHECTALDEDSARLYLEQLHSRTNFSGIGQRLYCSSDGNASLLLNYEDHFLMQQFGAGFNLEELYRKLETADELLEEEFTYAVSMEFGYLRSHIDKVGSGLEADVLLHLPALAADASFDEVLAHAQREGIHVSRFGGGASDSLGQVYQLSCSGILGSNESETLEKLALVVVEFIHYERDSRRRMLENGGVRVLDHMWRCWALAAHTRLLNFSESMDLLSTIRLGQSLSQLPRTKEPLNALFFLSQPAHLKKLAGFPEFTDVSGKNLLDEQLRAALFREMLEEG